MRGMQAMLPGNFQATVTRMQLKFALGQTPIGPPQARCLAPPIKERCQCRRKRRLKWRLNSPNLPTKGLVGPNIA